MGRAGYTDDLDNNWDLICYRGQVASALRGKRGQAFLKELIEALYALPDRKLIENELQNENGVCALGSVGVKRGLPMEGLDPDDPDTLASKFGVAHQLIRELEWMNDEAGPWKDTPENRWERVMNWATAQLITESPRTLLQHPR